MHKSNYDIAASYVGEDDSNHLGYKQQTDRQTSQDTKTKGDNNTLMWLMIIVWQVRRGKRGPACGK